MVSRACAHLRLGRNMPHHSPLIQRISIEFKKGICLGAGQMLVGQMPLVMCHEWGSCDEGDAISFLFGKELPAFFAHSNAKQKETSYSFCHSIQIFRLLTLRQRIQRSHATNGLKCIAQSCIKKSLSHVRHMRVFECR